MIMRARQGTVRGRRLQGHSESLMRAYRGHGEVHESTSGGRLHEGMVPHVFTQMMPPNYISPAPGGLVAQARCRAPQRAHRSLDHATLASRAPHDHGDGDGPGGGDGIGLSMNVRF